MTHKDINIAEFLRTGVDLKLHLANYLKLTLEELELRLPKGVDELAALHPVGINSEEATSFYEDKVGTAHLLDLGSWHLSSADYIADTLRLQMMFANGKVLDFGGGIGTHALLAAANPNVEHVYFVDLNPHNRKFVKYRAEKLGLDGLISVHRDLDNLGPQKFDTLICLDVLEHLPDPSSQLIAFLKCLSPNGIAIFNWYFFKGNNGEFPFHFDDKDMIESFFLTLQKNFLEVFHPFLITARAYKSI